MPASERVSWESEHQAMACTFGMSLWGRDTAHLRAVSQECWDLVDALEEQLSAHIPSSDICWINATAAQHPVQVEPHLYGLLQECATLHDQTGGAFDVTAGPLIRCWGFHQRQGRIPEPAELEEAMERVGMRHVLLDPEGRTVAFARPGVEINLGAIGKGYALRRILEEIDRYDVEAALVHSGGSTVAARSAPPGSDGWRVGVTHPESKERIARLRLRDRAFSTSGSTDQFFVHEGRVYGHILDPRTGEPAGGIRCNWVAAPDPAEADALSTALVAMGIEESRSFLSRRPDAAALLLPSGAGAEPVDLGLGRELEPPL